MSDRKCFSKYQTIAEQYEKNLKSISKVKKKIRFMLPLTIYCKICSSKNPKGKKLNAIKEKVLKKNYMGIYFFRFYFRCLFCSSGLSIVTNLHELNYTPEINCF